MTAFPDCCVREGQYERATVLPVFLITLLSVCSMAGLYTLSYFRLRSLEEGAGGLSTRLQVGGKGERRRGERVSGEAGGGGKEGCKGTASRRMRASGVKRGWAQAAVCVRPGGIRTCPSCILRS